MTYPDEIPETPEYKHPPESPEDITPADEVFTVGDDVLIRHGPGQETRIPKEEFYG